MEKKDTKTQLINEITTTGLQTAAKKLGASASKAQIRKGVSKNISLIDKLLRIVLIKSKDSSKRVQSDIEFVGLGIIAAHTFYRGFKKKKRLLIFEGVFLTAALGGVLLATQFKALKRQIA
ncbi:putative membrane protein [Flavobacterium sp. W4I14]|nr:putative membrane protein [Flavobacterium sp. W4I14]